MLLSSVILLAWAKRAEVQRVQAGVISSLHESRNFDAITHKDNRLRDKNMQVTQTSPEKDANTAEKSINKDNA